MDESSIDRPFHFDFNDAELWEDPYPDYAIMRRHYPVMRVEPGGMWAVSRYEDVSRVLQDPDTFSSRGWSAIMEVPWCRYNPLADAPLVLDGREHKSQRAVFAQALGHRVIPRIEPIARRICAEFADQVAGGEVIDVHEFATMLPASVITDIMGVDSISVEKLRQWTPFLFSANVDTPEELRKPMITAIDEFEAAIMEIYADRRRKPRDDFATYLLNAEVDGQKLTEKQLVSFMFLLVSAGFETTTQLLQHAMRMLAAYPQLWRRLREDPDAIDPFIDETLRRECPIHGILRMATVDTELAGKRIAKGEFVLPMLASANRDQTRFENPDDFDIDRKPVTNAAFGLGSHFCIGAALARAETRFMIEALLQRVGSSRVIGDVGWGRALLVRDIARLDMVFEPLAGDTGS
jgi:cytochrome P450